jgi:hypothetical protein
MPCRDEGMDDRLGRLKADRQLLFPAAFKFGRNQAVVGVDQVVGTNGRYRHPG